MTDRADADATETPVTDTDATETAVTDTDATEPAAAETDGATADAPPIRLSKAEKLEAKAARLREAEERRAEAAAQRASAGTTPRPTGLIVAVCLLSLITAALVAVLIVGYLSWQHQRDLNSARAQAAKAATRFALDFGSYDYQHLDSEFSAVAARMTPDFAKSYTDTSNKLKPTLVQYKSKVTATVQGSGVTSVSTAQATVVVFLDQTVTTSQSTTPRIDRNRLQIQLVRKNGKWLVAKLLAK